MPRSTRRTRTHKISLISKSYLASSIAALTLFGSTALAQTASPGTAQNWPTKPIRMIVPFPAGGTSDILTRLVGAKLTEVWGQQIIADNRTGANGNIGVEIVVRSPADGYTMVLMDVGNLSTSPSMYLKLPFDIIRDLTPITTVTYSPYLLIAHPSVPANNVAALMTLAKAQPGKLNFPVGLGSNIHLSGLALQQRTGAGWTYVPTKGGMSSIMSVMTGESDFLMMGVIQTWPHVKSGKLKLIAISSESRDPLFPQLPTIAESPGLEGYTAGSWQGILGPAKMPAEIVNKTYLEVKRIIALPDIHDKLSSQGSRPQAKTPQEMAKWLANEKDRWIKVVKASGYKIE